MTEMTEFGLLFFWGGGFAFFVFQKVDLSAKLKTQAKIFLFFHFLLD